MIANSLLPPPPSAFSSSSNPSSSSSLGGALGAGNTPNDTQNQSQSHFLLEKEDHLLTHHYETIEKALELQSSLSILKESFAHYPELAHYFPQTIDEIEIQQFNLLGNLPTRLFLLHQHHQQQLQQLQQQQQQHSDSQLQPQLQLQLHELIAYWILEKRDLLNSFTLSSFLSQVTNQSVLYTIACKICSLEIGQDFIEGLKYYLPVCGFWQSMNTTTNTTLSPPSIAATIGGGGGGGGWSEEEEKEAFLTYILEIYVKAHLNYSQVPLLSNSLEHFLALIEISKATMELCQSLQEQNKSQTSMMSEFYQKVRIALRKTDGITLSSKNINGLFISASSSLIADIIPQQQHQQQQRKTGGGEAAGNDAIGGGAGGGVPSYLFTSIKKIGFLSFGISLTDDQQFQEYEVYLTTNALYLFLPTTTTSVTTSGTANPNNNNNNNNNPLQGSFMRNNNNNNNNPSSSSLPLSLPFPVQTRKRLYAIIPLKNIHIEKCLGCEIDEDIFASNAIEFLNIYGEKIYWILMDECRYQPQQQQLVGNSQLPPPPQSEYLFDVPRQIEYFNQLVLKVKSPEGGENVGNGIANYLHQTNPFEEWLDLLEACCWQTNH